MEDSYKMLCVYTCFGQCAWFKKSVGSSTLILIPGQFQESASIMVANAGFKNRVYLE